MIHRGQNLPCDVTFPCPSSPLPSSNQIFAYQSAKETGKLHWTERILIKQTPYKAENEAFAGKGGTTLFKEKT